MSLNELVDDFGEPMDDWIMCNGSERPGHGEDVWLCFDYIPRTTFAAYPNLSRSKQYKPERKLEKARWFLSYWEVSGYEVDRIKPIAWTRSLNTSSPTKLIEIFENVQPASNDTCVAVTEKDKDKKEIIKPLIGITPRWVHNEKRMYEILDGMERYSQEQKAIPIDWIKEAREIFEYLMSKKGYENG